MQTKFTCFTDSQWQYMEKILEKGEGKRKRRYDLRLIMEAIFWITRTGVQWRNLDSKYPSWQLVYYYFNKWHKQGILKELLSVLVRAERTHQGREAEPGNPRRHNNHPGTLSLNTPDSWEQISNPLYTKFGLSLQRQPEQQLEIIVFLIWFHQVYNIRLMAFV